MYSTTASTTPCVSSFFTGLYSEKNGVNSLRESEINDDISTLAEVIRSEGYHTKAFVTGPLVEETGINRGFDDFNYREHGDDLFSGWKPTLIDELDSLKEPFFLYLHLWELHQDITVPKEYDAPRYGDMPYDRALSALDRELEEIVSHLPEDTTVILNGDHGESVYPRYSKLSHALRRGRIRLRYNRGIDTRPLERLANRIYDRVGESVHDHYTERYHGQNVYDYSTHVPFIIKGGEIGQNTIDTQCRQIDIFPTVLDLLGIRFDRTIDGESLLDEELSDRPCYMRACSPVLRGEQNWQRAVRANGYKYIEYPNAEFGSELYDLEDDPKELSPIDAPEVEAHLREMLPEEGLQDAADMGIDDRLRDLGYLE